MSNIFGKSNTITLKTTQSDYTEADDGSISFIKNKPTLLTTEAIQNIVGAMVNGGTEINIAVTYDDDNGKLNFTSTDTQLTEGQVRTKMAALIEKEDTTNNTLLKFNGTTKMTLGEIGGGSIASFTTAELAGNTLVCDTTLRSNQSTTATSGDFLLKRNDALKLTFGNTITTFEDKIHFKKNIGINEANPLAPLTVKTGLENTNKVAYAGSLTSYFYQGTTFISQHNGSHFNVSIYAGRSIVSGDAMIVANGVMSTSDDRIKTQTTAIENATDTLMKLESVEYMKHPNYMVDEEDESPVDLDASGNKIEQFKESGLIAQKVFKIDELNHLVGNNFNDETKQQLLNVNYVGLIPYLIKSIQELNQRIKQLENNI